MYRHISIFTLKNKTQRDQLIIKLNEIAKDPIIKCANYGINLTELPENVPGPDFGDVIQIIDFETKEDLDSYPTCKGHLDLLKNGPEMVKVTAIDYKLR